MERFEHKVVVMTGAASGIGLACARGFAGQGARTVLVDVDAAAGEAALASLPGGPARASFVRADVRRAADLAAAFAEADRRFGGVDVLVNNAGVNLVGRVDELDEAAWDACLDINLKGAFLASREALPRLRARGGGVIVNVASNAGLLARAADPAYCASKAGLIMLTRSMALAHAADRIRVNAVCPGPVDGTRLMDDYLAARPPQAAADLLASAPMAAALGRLITPEEVASAIQYLCSDQAQMITGAVIPIDGGKSAGAVR